MSQTNELDLDKLSIDQLNEILISKQQILHKIKRQLNSLPISNMQVYNKPDQQLKHIIIILNSHQNEKITTTSSGDRDDMLRSRIQQYNQKLIEQEEKLQKLTKERDFLSNLNKELRLHGFNNLLIDYKEYLADIDDKIEKQHKQDNQITWLKEEIRDKEIEKAMLQDEAQQMQIQQQALARQYEVEEQVLRSQMSQKSEKRQENIMSKFEHDEKSINDSLARQLNEQEQQLSVLEDKYMDLDRAVRDNSDKIESKEQQIKLIQAEIDKVSWELNGTNIQLQSALSVMQMMALDVEIMQSRVYALDMIANDTEQLMSKIDQMQQDAIIYLNEIQLFTSAKDKIDVQ